MGGSSQRGPAKSRHIPFKEKHLIQCAKLQHERDASSHTWTTQGAPAYQIVLQLASVLEKHGALQSRGVYVIVKVSTALAQRHEP